MIGKIHSFQSLGTLDGPGVRFVIFMHGCNLKCGYCHNIDVCRGEYNEYTPYDVMHKILRYKDYFGEKGGVTVSGGEPLLQAEFLEELFELCKKHNIHTALDTSGSIWSESVKKVLALTDLVLLDIKMTDDDDYRKFIGCGMDLPISFLNFLDKMKIDCWIRHVVVGGLNDTEGDARKLKQLIGVKDCVKRIDILPFKKVCSQKYADMNIPFPFSKFDEPDRDTIKLFEYVMST